ncbi:haloacid dehalogenase [Niveispirillum lacus]|uniref:Haloacid dehalogenase n=1 Tax=Niveispirillum lacus TaxID=1981099 RepID=A0A255YWF7_9PROT|nr:HAD-IA family hydrolase [Niveispirillum lacus]OYQ32750.1 haloacid dehalogenase [Niveispirillum lacus]
MSLKLALFDCDGTLVDSQHAIVAAMEAGFADQGLPPPAARDVRRVVGLPLVDAVARLAPTLSVTTHEAISEAYKAAFYRNRLAGTHSEPLFDGVVAALDALEAAGFLLGIATGKSRRGLDATLAHHGLAHRFVTLQTSDRVAGKPSPDMVFAALAESGADAAGTVVIGDTSFDILMARNARVRSIGVAWGYHDGAELLAAGADLLVQEYAALPDAVRGLLVRD